MTKRFAYLMLALALVVAPAAACNDDMDDRKESSDENATEQSAPADTARPPA